jgi:uncharacterized protein YcfJ
MNRTFQGLFALIGVAFAADAAARITFYEGANFSGRAFTTAESVWNFSGSFNDRASSVLIEQGHWEVCEHARFEGRCVVLRPGRYPSLRQVGMDNTISSARMVPAGTEPSAARPPGHGGVPPGHGGMPPGLAKKGRPYVGPPPVAVYEPPRPSYHEVPVVSSRAVHAVPTQRCWTERERVAQPTREGPNIGGAVVGGIVGGVLGNQVGGGSGKDLATAGGAIAGAAIGANVNRGSGGYVERDVQRCETVVNAQPAYWEVTYVHGGVEHRVQLSAAPGRTVRVDAAGALVLSAP